MRYTTKTDIRFQVKYARNKVNIRQSFDSICIKMARLITMGVHHCLRSRLCSLVYHFAFLRLRSYTPHPFQTAPSRIPHASRPACRSTKGFRNVRMHTMICENRNCVKFTRWYNLPAGCDSSDEELGAVSAGASICHREKPYRVHGRGKLLR